MNKYFKRNAQIFSGCNDFRRFIQESGIFVDKTLFIEQIIQNQRQVIAIIRPRRWGKSINLSMLFYYFSIVHDKAGNRLQNKNLILFEGNEAETQKSNGNSKIFKKLLIAQHPQFQNKFKEFHGKFPMIMLDWKKIRQDNYEKILQKIRQTISQQYSKHPYLKYLVNENMGLNKRFNNLFHNSPQTTTSDLQKSLVFLSELLSEHYNQKVFILIDQFDAQFKYLLQKQLKQTNKNQKLKIKEERIKILNFMTKILSSTFKGNIYLQKGIITGILYTLNTNSSYGLNNIKIYNISQKPFSNSYGFSKKQIIQQLIQKMFIGQNQQVKRGIQKLVSNITQYYNGYVVQDGENDKRKIYNPHNVSEYLKQCAQNQRIINCSSFWAKSGSDIFIKLYFNRQLYRRQSQSRLHLKEAVCLKYDRDINLVDMCLDKISQQHLTYLLLNLGYITGEEVTDNIIKAIIPNRQILQYFKSTFIKWLTSKFKHQFLDSQQTSNHPENNQIIQEQNQQNQYSKDYNEQPSKYHNHY